MRRLARTLLALDQPQETRFFLFLAAFGLAITIIYGLWSYEPAGTFLLGGFTVATGVLGILLALDPRAAAVRRRAGDVTPDLRPERKDVGGGAGRGDVDRPFLDEAGRLPDESAAPFAVGIGVSIAVTAPIFGAAPLILGALPLAWGAWAWLRGASDELEATRSARATTVRTAGPAAAEGPGDRSNDAASGGDSA